MAIVSRGLARGGQGSVVASGLGRSSLITIITGQIKVWLGAWVAKPVKWWNGSAFVTKPLKYWDGSSWQETPY